MKHEPKFIIDVRIKCPQDGDRIVPCSECKAKSKKPCIAYFTDDEIAGALIKFAMKVKSGESIPEPIEKEE